jgi:hypothetical protein
MDMDIGEGVQITLIICGTILLLTYLQEG